MQVVYQNTFVVQFYLLVGSDKVQSELHTIKLHKRPDYDRDIILKDIMEEETKVFYGRELDDHLSEIKGLTQVVRKAYGLMGFIKFLKGFYIVLITEKKKIAKLGRHSIYQVEDIIIKPLFTQSSGSSESKEEEAKYVQAFKDIGIANGFYFSYTYDITHSLQYNVLRQIKKQNERDQSLNNNYNNDVSADSASQMNFDEEEIKKGGEKIEEAQKNNRDAFNDS